MTKIIAVTQHPLALIALTICASTSASAGTAEFIPIGDLPGGDFQSSVQNISGDGTTVVGWSIANNNQSGQLRAFRWRQNLGITPLGHIGPETNVSIAIAASFDGSIIIGRSGDAFRWTENTAMQSIGTCEALGISGDGSLVVGYCPTAQGNEAATWTNANGWIMFGALGTTVIDAFFFSANHDGSILCGQSIFDTFNVEPIRWTEPAGMVGLGDIPGGLHYGLGLAISADGATIVGSAIGDVGQDAFRWTETTGLVNLELADPSPVTESESLDVSADGSIIVGYSDLHGAMIWDQTQGMRSVQQMLIDVYNITLTGWTLITAQAISDNGRTIAGNAWNPNGDLEGWLVRLPPFCAAGDVDDNNTVNVFDLLTLLSSWGPCAECPADFTNAAAGPPDGAVDVFDLLALLNQWGDCPIP